MNSRRGVFLRYWTGFSLVETISIVEPQDTSLLTSTDDDVLTLITCYPFGASPTSPLRYIVRAASAQAAVSREQQRVPDRLDAR